MSFLDIIAEGAHAVFDWESGQSVRDTLARDDHATTLAFQGVEDQFNQLGRQLWKLIGVWVQEYGAMEWVQDPSKQLAAALQDLAARQDESWTHLTTQTLPHTLGHLVGYVYSDGIVPLRSEARKLTSAVKFLDGWRGQIDAWRKHTVDPELKAWLEFHHWFNVNAAPPLDRLIGWFRHPATFATWAVPIIGAPYVTWLAHQAPSVVRDQLAALVADASPHVWRHVELAAAAILNTEV